MRLGRVSALMTRLALGQLRRRACTPERFRELAAASAFGACEIRARGIGMEIRLAKR